MHIVEYGIYLPTKLVEHIQPLLDFAFLEPCDDEEYISLYAGYSGVIKILDNGYVEFKDKAMGLKSLVKYNQRVMADIVVAPDVMGNWYYNSVQARILAKEIGYQHVGVVLAGPNWQEQADWVSNHPYRAVFLPYRLNRVPVNFGQRVHLFGFKNPEAYFPFSAGAWICSIDTVEPISAAYHKWSYVDKGFASFPRPANYRELTGNTTSLDRFIDVSLAKENVLWLKDFFHNPVR